MSRQARRDSRLRQHGRTRDFGHPVWQKKWLIPALLSLLLIAAASINFVLFYSLAALFSIAIAITAFAIARHTYAITRNNFPFYSASGFLVTAVGLGALAELAFIVYAKEASVPVAIGHVLKLWSFWFVYLAVVHIARDLIETPAQERNHTIDSGEEAPQQQHDESLLRHAASVYKNSAAAVMISDRNHKIVAINPSFTRITGFSESDIIGRSDEMIEAPAHDAKFSSAFWRQVETTGSWQGEMSNWHKSGETFPVWEHISALRDGNGHITHYITTFTDITPIKESEARLDQLVHHDSLTGLNNRLLFHTRVAHALERAAREKTRFAILYIDLDNFKQVNDTLGREIGDRLLVATASRLESSVREEDTVARAGDDEFTLLLEPIRHGADASRVAEKIVKALHEPFFLDGQEVTATASIGISTFPEHGRDLDVLLNQANAAMCQVKQQGGDDYRYFAAELATGSRERLA